MSRIKPENIKIRSLQSHTGLYFNHVEDGKEILKNVALVINLDLAPLEESTVTIKNMLNSIDNLCIETKTGCKEFQQSARREVLKLDHRIRIISGIIGNSKRQRRGLANVIGTGLKVLFGTMDNEDAEYYQKVIQSISKNEDRIKNGMEENIKVLSHLNRQV